MKPLGNLLRQVIADATDNIEVGLGALEGQPLDMRTNGHVLDAEGCLRAALILLAQARKSIGPYPNLNNINLEDDRT